jgi:hypothetical protein
MLQKYNISRNYLEANGSGFIYRPFSSFPLQYLQKEQVFPLQSGLFIVIILIFVNFVKEIIAYNEKNRTHRNSRKKSGRIQFII